MSDVVPVPWTDDTARRRAGFEALAAYLNEKLDMGLLWRQDGKEYPIATRFGVDPNALLYALGYHYFTYARYHYNILVPELRRIMKQHIFDRRYEYYRILGKRHRGGRQIDLPRHCGEEDPIYDYNTKRLLPGDVMRVLLFTWPNNPFWLEEHWKGVK